MSQPIITGPLSILTPDSDSPILRPQAAASALTRLLQGQGFVQTSRPTFTPLKELEPADRLSQVETVARTMRTATQTSTIHGARTRLQLRSRGADAQLYAFDQVYRWTQTS